ncbi:TRAP transporter solute receptor, unknown substrate 6 [uncultured Gammaproteobacteria bacterium]|nr:TRAP transporter solute receptor, unknown substrate 6 [uncultured Gammaproteobacteria bacterium]
MDKVYAKHGIKSIIGGNTGNQMGGWFKKEINTIEDLKGLKMRIPGFAGEIMAALAPNPPTSQQASSTPHLTEARLTHSNGSVRHSICGWVFTNCTLLLHRLA